MKLDLDQPLANAKGEPFTTISVDAGSLWARLQRLQTEGKTLKEALDQVAEEIGGKDLLAPMDLGMVFWRAVDNSPAHGEKDPSTKRELARLAQKLTKAGVVDFDEKEIAILTKEIERFHGAMIVAVEDVIAAARVAAAEGAKLVAVDAKEEGAA